MNETIEEWRARIAANPPRRIKGLHDRMTPQRREFLRIQAHGRHKPRQPGAAT